MRPKNALTAAAASEAKKLRRYAAMTRGEATAATNSAHDMPAVFRNAAESGTKTISPR